MGEIREVNGEKADERESSHSLGYYTINTNQPLLPSPDHHFAHFYLLTRGLGECFKRPSPHIIVIFQNNIVIILSFQKIL